MQPRRAIGSTRSVLRYGMLRRPQVGRGSMVDFVFQALSKLRNTRLSHPSPAIQFDLTLYCPTVIKVSFKVYLGVTIGPPCLLGRQEGLLVRFIRQPREHCRADLLQFLFRALQPGLGAHPHLDRGCGAVTWGSARQLTNATQRVCRNHNRAYPQRHPHRTSSTDVTRTSATIDTQVTDKRQYCTGRPLA